MNTFYFISSRGTLTDALPAPSSLLSTLLLLCSILLLLFMHTQIAEPILGPEAEAFPVSEGTNIEILLAKSSKTRATN